MRASVSVAIREEEMEVWVWEVVCWEEGDGEERAWKRMVSKRCMSWVVVWVRWAWRRGAGRWDIFNCL